MRRNEQFQHITTLYIINNVFQKMSIPALNVHPSCLLNLMKNALYLICQLNPTNFKLNFACKITRRYVSAYEFWTFRSSRQLGCASEIQ